MRYARLLLAALFVLSLLPAVSAGATVLDLSDVLDVDLLDPSEDLTASPNMSHVANLQWEDSFRRDGGRTIDTQGGTDVEFATIDGRDYAVAGTYQNGLQIIDVTDPEQPTQAGWYHCNILQGDVQTFTREDLDADGNAYTRHLVTYTADSGYTANPSACFQDIGATPGVGTLIIDITDPTEPRSVSHITFAGGSHNQTIHPDGNYLYNSNSGGCGDCIEVIDITDLANPVIHTKLPIGTLDDSHDLTFNTDGTRAYSAAINGTVIINTEDPADPSVITTIFDPAVTLHHQSDPVTIGDREFVVINDELAGAAGNEVCPGGGLHVWEITGDMEDNPVKVGAFFTPELTVRQGAGTGLAGTVTCTSHVFRIYPEQEKLVIGWFGAGVHVIDMSGLADLPVGGSVGVAGQSIGAGMVEVGFARFVDSDTWSAKVMEWDADGSAYIFADDQTRGFDVYRFDNTAETAENPGTWLTPADAQLRLDTLLASGFQPKQYLICDLTLGRAQLSQ